MTESATSVNGFANGVHSKTQCPSSRKYVTLHNIMDPNLTSQDILHRKACLRDVPCTETRCLGSVMFPVVSTTQNYETILREAEDFLRQYYTSINKLDSDAHRKRWEQVRTDIEEKGWYEHTFRELAFGAKTAWRNAPRCIGRIQWSNITTFDGRHVATARGMFDMLCSQLKFATNGGILRSSITIFAPRTDSKRVFRIWNNGLLCYAGYEQPDGSVIGDPANVEITNIALKLGWKGKGGMFDLLPLILQAGGEDPEVFEIPPECALEVHLKHPRFKWFEELGWRWTAVPAVCGMMMDCGGVQYTATAFSGWFMNTEVAARDLCDSGRYNLLGVVAEKMGLDTSNNVSLWKDQALLEMNIAVLHSYQSAGVSMVDHHSASESFMRHLENENRLRGGCPGDWIWIVPPMSGNLMSVFHQEMLLYNLKPSYEYQRKAWETHEWKNTQLKPHVSKRQEKIKFKDLARAVKFSAKLMTKAMANRVKCTVVYGSETGRSKHYAQVLSNMFNRAFSSQVLCMDECSLIELCDVPLVLFVTSTFGNGDPPENGEAFYKELKIASKGSSRPIQSTTNHTRSKLRRALTLDQSPDVLENIHYAVFGLGSRAYPNFCAFARYIDETLDVLGAERVCAVGEGDELCGQDESFSQWSNKVFASCCEVFCIGDVSSMLNVVTDKRWGPGKYRISPGTGPMATLADGLIETHKRTVFNARVISINHLQAENSDRQTILVKLDASDVPDITYEPGDHLGVYPTNRAAMVEKLIGQLSGSQYPDTPIELEMSTEVTSLSGNTVKWSTYKRFPQPTTLRKAFSHYLDIASTPTIELLAQLAPLADDEEERGHLENLATDCDKYDAWRYSVAPNIVELLDMFPSLRPPASLLLSQLPLLQHRLYSISSSLDANPEEIHLTVAVVAYMKNDGKGPLHQGVCSTWLDSLQPGDNVPCFLKTSRLFHLPTNPESPIIMIGPGTGIAPFRGFWQQKHFEMNKGEQKYGEMTLYFGCRQFKIDNIFGNELKEMEEKCVLTGVQIALSREKDKSKTYVQDLMLKNGRNLYDALVTRQGHVYVCGDITMAKDVTKTLGQIFAEYGNIGTDAAKEMLDQMRSTNKLHEDIFGVTLRTQEVTKRNRKISVNLIKSKKV